MKDLQTRNAPKLSALKAEHTYHIFYVEKIVSTVIHGIHISWIGLITIAALCLGAFFAVESKNSSAPTPPYSSSAAAQEDALETSPDDPVASGLHTSGFVFPDSAERLLTEADITSVMSSDTYTVKELLRFAVNEIYTRNGYEFSTAFYREFYRQFDWYKGGLSAEQAVLAFNRYERKNVDFLLSVEARYSP